MKTSTAMENGFKCPVCGSPLTQDRIGRGFVRHLGRRILDTGEICKKGITEKDSKS